MLGLTNLFVSGKRYILHSRARMTGGEIGRLFLDPLNMAVHQGEIPVAVGGPSPNAWGLANNPLTPGTYCCDTHAAFTAGGVTVPACNTLLPSGCPSADERRLGLSNPYNATYEIRRLVAPNDRIIKVKLYVTWTEP